MGLLILCQLSAVTGMCAPGSKEWKRRLSWMRTAFYVGTVAMATYLVLQNVVAYEVAVLVPVLFGGIR